MNDNTNDKTVINTQGGPVIQGGTFENVEFVANKYVMASASAPTRVPADAAVAEVVESEETAVCTECCPAATDTETRRLPIAISHRIRSNQQLAHDLFSIMRDEIVPNTGRAGSRWKWSHVRKVMADESIIPSDTNDTDFGRIIGAMDLGVTYEQVRTNCKNNELQHLKQGCGRRYDYTDVFTECVKCMEVAEALKPIIEFVGK